MKNFLLTKSPEKPNESSNLPTEHLEYVASLERQVKRHEEDILKLVHCKNTV